MRRTDTAPASTPLNAFPLIAARSVDTFCEGITRLFADSSFDVTIDRKSHQPFEANVGFRRFGRVGLMHGSYSARISATFSDVKFYTQGLPVRGAGRQATGGHAHIVGNMTGGVLSPDTEIGLVFDAGFEHYAFLIEPEAVVAKLTALTGRRLDAPPRFTGETNFRTPAAQRLRKLATQFASRSGDAGAIPLIISELEQRTIVLFLFANSHDHSHWLDTDPPPAAPWQVRRTEDYIEAHWDRPIAIEALSDLCGCSVRSLFHHFRRSRGYSPMEFQRHVRLHRAHALLSRPDEATSVTRIAFGCGFGNLGHFSTYFREAFGEKPSEVLARARRRSDV
ncbi:MAG: AraC family transcriptional regulator [Pseudorhodoplanes sp.]|uniref:helix-turn-helix transcriptional regulator n=1 Tax=Pseudorhodoplanes sp. TaxID=1934341 RepID=UPI003D1021AF